MDPVPNLSVSIIMLSYSSFFFFFNDTATTEIYTLSLHDALPILRRETAEAPRDRRRAVGFPGRGLGGAAGAAGGARSEEHTSELQSQSNLVCRLLLEKKKKKKNHTLIIRISHAEIRYYRCTS